MATDNIDSADALISQIKKGVTAESAREYVGNYMWARLWKAVTSLANCPPDLNQLLLYKAEISACMKLAQEIQLNMSNAEEATKRMKDLFTAKIQMP